MKRTVTLVLAVALALSMTGCEALDAILNVNLFSSMAAVKAADIEGADAGTLLELSASPSFYAALSGSPSTKTSALATIDGALGGSLPPATEQELLALAAEIELRTTPAWDLVNNIGSLLSKLISGEPIDEANLENVIRGILPDSVLGAGGVINETAFLSMIAGLELAYLRYDDLGNAIGTGGYADGSDVIAGDIAQSAIVAAMVATIARPVSYGGTQTTGAYLYALLLGTADPPDTFDFDAMTSVPSLANILSAAGISFS
ncbi:MAG: hypothetical protein CVV51_12575 [Spirochaetae bacterium HGW-Spirochaetae-7]|jgi:hypothetical protein|nr:MAG: hypothetical protein CVV51_12575 [Spirochaetae bacterium HGW-Spirochaetae-7]